jgi:hypothetical protein
MSKDASLVRTDSVLSLFAANPNPAFGINQHAPRNLKRIPKLLLSSVIGVGAGRELRELSRMEKHFPSIRVRLAQIRHLRSWKKCQDPPLTSEPSFSSLPSVESGIAARGNRRRCSIQEMETRLHWPAAGGGKMCSASHAWKLSSDSTMCLYPSAVT